MIAVTVRRDDRPHSGGRSGNDSQQSLCVNRLECRSTFRWEGEVTTEEEVVLLAKTTAERYDELQDRAVELHPYEVPCVERFDEADVLESFGAWLDESVR